MSALARVKIQFSLEFPCGPWDESTPLSQINKSVEGDAQRLASRLVGTLAKETGHRLTVDKIVGPILVFPKE